METIRIQEYTHQYRDAVIDLILTIQQREFGIPIQKQDQPDLLDIPNVYQIGAGNFWLACCNGHVVGTVGLLDIDAGQGALRKMYVQAAYRGATHNTAKLLLRQVSEWAQINRIREIYLGTTDKYLAAHRFYEKNGLIRITADQLPPTFPVMKVDSRFYKYLVPDGDR